MTTDVAGFGIDRRTGRQLSGWLHTVQSIEVIFTTRIGERVMRRHFGSGALVLLGRAMTSENVIRFWSLVGIAIDQWEPRFKINRFVVPATNTPETVRQGALTLGIEGSYRPRAHLGDFTPEVGLRTIGVGLAANGITVRSA
jgi:phage baseplate assembly protein W